MAFGDCPHDKALRDAWQDFCEQLNAAGDQVFKDYNPATPLQRADGFRFLTQNLSQAFDLALETKDTRYPMLHAFCAPDRKLGGDNADFIYLQAWIDGESVYKITGNKGTARFLNFTVQGPRPEKHVHRLAESPRALRRHSGGESLRAPDEDRVRWILRALHRRRAARSRTGCRRRRARASSSSGRDSTAGTRLPRAFRIERIDMDDPRPMPTPETIRTAIGWAGDFLTGVMRDWPDHPVSLQRRGGRSRASECLPTRPRQRHGPTRSAARGCQHVLAARTGRSADHRVRAHDGFWMFTKMGAFFNSMDYLYRPVSYTPARTAVDSDGKVRLVMTHDDPGYHNWLDTQGFVRGNLTYRNLMSSAVTRFRTQVVKRGALDAALPRGSARVTPDERLAQMRARFDGIRQRYGL